MQAEVREPVRGRLAVEGVDDMDEAKFIADPLDEMGSPRTAEFDPLHGLGLDGLEEPEQVRPMGVRRPERRGRLE